MHRAEQAGQDPPNKTQTPFPVMVGSSDGEVTRWQMSLRALLIFLYGLVLIRLGPRRIFGKNMVYDVLLAVVLGSALSGALTGNAPLVPTLAAATALVVLHALLGRLALGLPAVGRLVKGSETLLLRDGEIDRRALRRSNLTERDLMEALRLKRAVAAFAISLVGRCRGSRSCWQGPARAGLGVAQRRSPRRTDHRWVLRPGRIPLAEAGPGLTRAQ